MKSNKLLIGIVSLVLMFMLAACSNNSTDKNIDKKSNTNHENMKMDNKNSTMDDKNMDMGKMEHSGSGEVPKGLKKAENPTYKVGSQAIVKSEHMEGMNGAEAT